MDDSKQYDAMVRDAVLGQKDDAELARLTREWFLATSRHKYTYRYSWMGRPIIQRPQDILAMQELIWEIKPDLIIETGVARGGSLIFYASMLELLKEDGIVVGIDIDIRAHNRKAIEEHPLAERIVMIEGSSISPEVVRKVHKLAEGKKHVLVCLDSMHTEEHVLEELRSYSSLVTKDSYLVVFDTVIEDMPENSFPNRPWDIGNNPKTAVRKFMKENDRFVIDDYLQSKLLITVAPDGYLRCVKS